jgi:hypothetical protein
MAKKAGVPDDVLARFKTAKEIDDYFVEKGYYGVCWRGKSPGASGKPNGTS